MKVPQWTILNDTDLTVNMSIIIQVHQTKICNFSFYSIPSTLASYQLMGKYNTPVSLFLDDLPNFRLYLAFGRAEKSGKSHYA